MESISPDDAALDARAGSMIQVASRAAFADRVYWPRCGVAAIEEGSGLAALLMRRASALPGT